MSEIRHVVHTFLPVISENTTVLLLGSVPSVKSMEQGFYYMHKQNRFWKVLSLLLGEDLYNSPIANRIEVLKRVGIGLYDAVEECDIQGSSDNKIYNVVPTDLEKLIKGTKVNAIFCLGDKSYLIATKNNATLKGIIKKLPSTSPANAKMSLENLVKEFQVVLDCLE